MALRSGTPGSVTGACRFTAASDGVVHLWIGETKVIDKARNTSREVEGTIKLTEGKEYPIRVEYIHRHGKASIHVSLSSRDFEKRILRLSDE